jgi:hypothetical protein
MNKVKFFAATIAMCLFIGCGNGDDEPTINFVSGKVEITFEWEHGELADYRPSINITYASGFEPRSINFSREQLTANPFIYEVQNANGDVGILVTGIGSVAIDGERHYLRITGRLLVDGQERGRVRRTENDGAEGGNQFVILW